MEKFILLILIILKFSFALAYGSNNAPSPVTDYWALLSNAVIIILLGWLGNNMRKQRENLEKRVNSLDKKFNTFNTKFAKWEGKLETYLGE